MGPQSNEVSDELCPVVLPQLWSRCKGKQVALVLLLIKGSMLDVACKLDNVGMAKGMPTVDWKDIEGEEKSTGPQNWVMISNVLLWNLLPSFSSFSHGQVTSHYSFHFPPSFHHQLHITLPLLFLSDLLPDSAFPYAGTSPYAPTVTKRPALLLIKTFWTFFINNSLFLETLPKSPDKKIR